MRVEEEVEAVRSDKLVNSDVELMEDKEVNREVEEVVSQNQDYYTKKKKMDGVKLYLEKYLAVDYMHEVENVVESGV
jgi:hypothetical protein